MTTPGEPKARGPATPVGILVIEDEPQMMRFLRASLSGSGYRVLEATTGASGLAEAAARGPGIILLDLGLPDMDGVEVARRLREWSAVPIIVLSARGQERDKIEALDAGADDYLTKPFGVGELLARMRAALRRAAASESDAGASLLRAGPLSVDLAGHQVSLEDRPVHLTPIEFRILACLAKHPDRVLTHRQILKEVWGPNAVEQTHYLRVYMAQLRHKIESDPARPTLLITEPGVGYRLRTER